MAALSYSIIAIVCMMGLLIIPPLGGPNRPGDGDHNGYIENGQVEESN